MGTSPPRAGSATNGTSTAEPFWLPVVFHLQDKVVSQLCGEDEGRSLGGQDQTGLESAEALIGADGMKRLGRRGADGRQGNHDHGLGIAEGGGRLRRRLRLSPVGRANAGMYWKCAVCSEARIFAVSTMAPMYGL